MSKGPTLFRVALEVGNGARAARFYERLLGVPGRAVGGARHYFDCGGAIVALIEVPKPEPAPENLYFAVANLPAVHARARPENPLGDPFDNKKYIHDLQVYGGTANVLAAEFREWFAGLWYGKNLAYTIAVLTILVVLVVRFTMLTNPSADEAHGDDSSGSRPAGAG
jgi:hypothetical protein